MPTELRLKSNRWLRQVVSGKTFGTVLNVGCGADAIRTRCKLTKIGICHEVRTGVEVKFLRETLGCEVIGTEISNSATEVEHVIEWDVGQFHGEIHSPIGGGRSVLIAGPKV